MTSPQGLESSTASSSLTGSVAPNDVTYDAAIRAKQSGLSLYQILGVSSAASATEIKKSYRKLALKLHPDKTSDPNDHAQFEMVSFAYQILGNESQRGVYDRLGFDGLDVLKRMEAGQQHQACLDHPCMKGLFYFFGLVTLGYFCCCFCFCCNCCCGKCENCMSHVVGDRVMHIYRQAVKEADVKEAMGAGERVETV